MQPRKQAEAFFFEWAGYGYDPKTETPTQGRRHGAQRLAAAERAAWRNGAAFVWSVDSDLTSGEWCDEEPAYEQYQCALLDKDGKCQASLHGIDFGREGFPSDGDPYRRVVEAELAQEARDRI